MSCYVEGFGNHYRIIEVYFAENHGAIERSFGLAVSGSIRAVLAVFCRKIRLHAVLSIHDYCRFVEFLSMP